MGVEGYTYSECWFLFGHNDVIDGSWASFQYLVVPRHGISSCRCSHIPQYPCKFFCCQFNGYWLMNSGKIPFSCSFWWLVCIHDKQALGSAIIKRIRGFIKLTRALHTLHGALPDASAEELESYDDECAICRVCSLSLSSLCVWKFLHLCKWQWWIMKIAGTNGQG